MAASSPNTKDTTTIILKNKKCLATQSIESMLVNRILKVNHILCWLMTMILYTIYISTVNLSLSLSLFSPSHVQDAKGFATCLLDFIGSNAQYLVSLMKTSSDVDTSEQGQKDRLKHVEMTLETLYHVIHNNSGVEMKCIGHFKLLFTLLGVQSASKAQHLALKVRTEV